MNIKFLSQLKISLHLLFIENALLCAAVIIDLLEKEEFGC